MRRALGVFVLGAAASICTQGQSSPLTLETVLKRTATYVAEYQTKLAGIVAEEHYRQTVFNSVSSGRNANVIPQRRELRSDLLLVKPQGDDRWIQFRDVFEVDGNPVRDRDERLFKLFLEPSPSAIAHASSIQLEGARFNVGPLFRTINVPILALMFLDADNQSRFTFRRGKAESQDLPEAFTADVWRIDYREVSRPTFIRGESNGDLQSRGKLWIDGQNGRVLKTELESGDTQVRAQVIVTYRSEPDLELLVPSEMKERYVMTRSMIRIDGTAQYSRFRQFKVVTTEKPKP